MTLRSRAFRGGFSSTPSCPTLLVFLFQHKWWSWPTLACGGAPSGAGRALFLTCSGTSLTRVLRGVGLFLTTTGTALTGSFGLATRRYFTGAALFRGRKIMRHKGLGNGSRSRSQRERKTRTQSLSSPRPRHSLSPHHHHTSPRSERHEPHHLAKTDAHKNQS